MRIASFVAQAILTAAIGGADPLPTKADRIVSYTIDVSLDATRHTLNGHQRVTWRNPSTDHVSDLWLHLYLNAFRNDKSTFFRESGGQLRDVEMPDDGWGWIDVTRFTLPNGTDLRRSLTFESPDDGNRDDRTVARVRLPDPVAPGATLTFDVEFAAQLPKVFARTGYAGDYHLVGQWFPKLGVYEPAGMRGRAAGGWNCHQFHADSEFYADYGSYRVAITTPSHFVVGATGEVVRERHNRDGTRTVTYAQDDVHDFAWTADPSFLVLKERFVAASEVSATEARAAAALVGRSIDEMRLSDVDVRLLLQPEHLPQAGRYFESVRRGLKHFGLWYGRYPYRVLTIVDPPHEDEGSGGMEYPTFITGATSMAFNRWPLNGMRLIEEVTVHELAHQYWYGLVGSNEFEEPWLDEGVTSYSTGEVVDRWFGEDRSFVDVLGLHVGHADLLRLSNHHRRVSDRIRQPAWSYVPDSYGFYAYAKPELALRTLEGMVGEETFARVMRTYAERWRFRHPTSNDFYAVASEIARRDLRPFFDQVFEGTDVVDYAVTALETTSAGESHQSTIIVQRRGGVILPQTLALAFEGGTTERIKWNGVDRWKRFTVTRRTRVMSADVDPDRRIWLDVDWMNNSRRLEPDTTVATTWAARCLYWLQQSLALVGL
jgi:hypothetical protein